MTLLSLVTVVALASDPEAFARSFAEGLNNGEDRLSPAFDMDAFLVRVADGLPMDDMVKEGLAGVAEGFSPRQFVEGILEHGRPVTLLRVSPPAPDGTRTALYRLGNGAVNYLKLTLAPGKDRVRVVDLEVFIDGGPKSQRLRALIEPKKPHDRLVKQLLEAFGGGDYKKVLSLRASLPEKLAQLPAVASARLKAAQFLHAAQEATDIDLIDALTERLESSPSDSGAPLARIVLATLKQDWSGALEAVDALDRIVEDPSLDSMRADLLRSAGRDDEAVKLLSKSKWANARWALVALALKAKDHAATAKWLDAAERGLSERLVPAKLDASYSEFLKSKEGKAWAKARQPKAKQPPAR